MNSLVSMKTHLIIIITTTLFLQSRAKLILMFRILSKEPRVMRILNTFKREMTSHTSKDSAQGEELGSDLGLIVTITVTYRDRLQHGKTMSTLTRFY
jgi:hypothetical protein